MSTFPEANAFHVTCLSQDKIHCLEHRQSLGRQALVEVLPQWLVLNQTHVVIRPLLASLVFVDLDNWIGTLQSLIDLKTRAVVVTSSNNYQAWFCIDGTLTARTALFVQRQLIEHLKGDPVACSAAQQGIAWQ